MAAITLKDLQEAYERGVEVGHSGLYDKEIIGNTFDEWLGTKWAENGNEPISDTTDEVILDLDSGYKLFETARGELVDSALSNNLSRPHHLDDAIATLEDVSTLFKAELIVREILDPRDFDEAPTEA